MAALPPYRSAQACLALGNLLIRGTSFSSAPTTPTEDGTVRRDSKSSQNESSPADSLPSPTIAKAFASFFRSTLPSTPAGNDDKRPSPSPTYTKRFDVSSNNWAIRKEGKRAMRDVEGMGVAGGWLVLGIAYIVEGELQRQDMKRKAQQAQALEFKKRSQVARPIPAADEGTGHVDGSDNDALVISFKPRSIIPLASSEEQTPTPNRARHFGSSTELSSESASLDSSTSASTVTLSQDRPKSQSGTEDTVESAELPTPGGFIVTADGVKVERKSAPASLETLKLIVSDRYLIPCCSVLKNFSSSCSNHCYTCIDTGTSKPLIPYTSLPSPLRNSPPYSKSPAITTSAETSGTSAASWRSSWGNWT